MEHPPEEIFEKTTGLDTGVKRIQDILRRLKKGKDLSKDETQIIDLHKLGLSNRPRSS